MGTYIKIKKSNVHLPFKNRLIFRILAALRNQNIFIVFIYECIKIIDKNYQNDCRKLVSNYIKLNYQQWKITNIRAPSHTTRMEKASARLLAEL